MPTSRTNLGTRGEELAQRFLREKGYLILETNYRCPWGEIDIVAHDGNELVFVEVRTRRSTRYGTPEESLTAAKARHLVAAAEEYLQQRGDNSLGWRIDLISVRLGQDYRVERIDHLKSVVEQ
jgi:putative endonuclease